MIDREWWIREERGRVVVRLFCAAHPSKGLGVVRTGSEPRDPSLSAQYLTGGHGGIPERIAHEPISLKVAEQWTAEAPLSLAIFCKACGRGRLKQTTYLDLIAWAEQGERDHDPAMQWLH